MATKRTKGRLTGPGNQAQIRFNEGACSDKVSESGLNYFYNNGEGLLGELNSAAVEVGKFKQVLVFNTTGSLGYVAFGDSTLAAPAGGATGVPIPAGQGVVLASGENTHIRASAATVFGYLAEDNVIEGIDQT